MQLLDKRYTIPLIAGTFALMLIVTWLFWPEITDRAVNGAFAVFAALALLGWLSCSVWAFLNDIDTTPRVVVILFAVLYVIMVAAPSSQYRVDHEPVVHNKNALPG